MTEPTIFIVDDDEAYRDSLVELVASVGLHCECFASALNFLAAFDPARSLLGWIEVLLSVSLFCAALMYTRWRFQYDRILTGER